MCGINLIYSRDDASIERWRIEAMNEALGHRGPDELNVFADKGIALGHTRLSIVDIAGGHQPMRSASNRFVIIFNGEIYNYRALQQQLRSQGVAFKTDSDTEVVLELFAREGLAGITRLRGMFAFAVYDIESACLFLIRDRLGIKPLFYARSGNQFVASSEAKGIFASGLVEPRFNVESIRDFFFYQFAVSPHTTFMDIYEVPPGNYLELRPGEEPKLTCYWDINFPRNGEYESLDEKYWTESFLDALGDATECHLIGEVPIGSYLSGGVDSSTIAWLLKERYDRPLKTFSIHFTNEAMDESDIYRRTAGFLGVQNVELTMDDQQEASFLPELKRCLYHLEQPQRLAVDIPHYLLSGLVQRNNYKVVYTGDGADELLGGYDCFRQDYMRLRGNQIANDQMRRQLYLTEFTQYFSEDYMRLLLELHDPEEQQETIARFGCYPAWFDFWNILGENALAVFNQDALLAAPHTGQFESLARQMKPHLENRHPLNQSLYIETKTRLPGWILWKGDRLSMAHSVEARVPFVDHELFELAARMPPEFKLRGMDEKYVLKKIARPHLPPHPSDHKKRAFYTPIREWFFTKERAAQVDPYLNTEALSRCGLFDTAYVASLREQLTNSTAPANYNSYYRIMKLEWTLMLVLSVQILHEQFILKRAPCFNRAQANASAVN